MTSDQLAREMTAEKEASMVKLEVAEKEIAKLSESSGATSNDVDGAERQVRGEFRKSRKGTQKERKRTRSVFQAR